MDEEILEPETESVSWKTFKDIPPEKHKQICIKVLKFWLKSYYKLNNNIFPRSSVLKQEEYINGVTDSGDSFCLKMDIDDAIEHLPLHLKKIIYLNYILDLPISKIILMLNYKYRIDGYRSLDECFEHLYNYLGPEWLRE